eukprot:5669029-Amphidinium_carterae.1
MELARTVSQKYGFRMEKPLGQNTSKYTSSGTKRHTNINFLDPSLPMPGPRVRNNNPPPRK